MTTSRKDGVAFEVADHVARVTIDRPAMLNAVDDAAQNRLDEIWDIVEPDRDIWVVVLTGSGERAFCVGSDMSAGAQDKSGVEYWAAANPNGYIGLTVRDSLTTPVIARVNGYALGGGMEIVLGCDIVIASEHAEFGLVEPKVGRMAFDGSILLSRRISYYAAMGLLLTGRRASAAEMQALGLVNEVVPSEQLDMAVQRWVDQICACAPSSLRATKQLVRTTQALSAREALAQRTFEVYRALTSENADEGVQAFREKRLPTWVSD